jgi:hypothetical protein
MEPQVIKKISENQDRVEIGTPGKGGAIKVYGDASNPEDFKKRVDNMLEIRKYANAQINIVLDRG